MIGTDLPQMSSETLALLTNEEVLALEKKSHGAYQVMRDENQCIWASYVNGCPHRESGVNLALFNLSDEEREVSVKLSEVKGILEGTIYSVRNLWDKSNLFPLDGAAELSLTVPAHGSVLLLLETK